MSLDFRRLFASNGEVSLKLYLVSCDLLQDADYASLRARLRTFEARPVLANQWALHSTHTAAQLKNILKDFLHDGDRIVVTEVGAERASRRALSTSRSCSVAFGGACQSEPSSDSSSRTKNVHRRLNTFSCDVRASASKCLLSGKRVRSASQATILRCLRARPLFDRASASKSHSQVSQPVPPRPRPWHRAVAPASRSAWNPLCPGICILEIVVSACWSSSSDSSRFM